MTTPLHASRGYAIAEAEEDRFVDAIDALLTRRSIRKYTDEPVSDSHIELLLKAAMSAPTGFNQQSWRFVVVRDPAVREKLSEVSQWSGMLASAPLVIVVCGEPGAERHPGTYWVQDATAALQSILVAANGLGLGAVWVGVHPWQDRKTAVAEAIGLPSTIEPLASIGIGHPAETKPPADRFDPGKVRYDTWAD